MCRRNPDHLALQIRTYISDLDTYEFEFFLPYSVDQKRPLFERHTYNTSSVGLKKCKFPNDRPLHDLTSGGEGNGSDWLDHYHHREH